MPTNDDVLIIGSLDDKALTDSIDKLISEVSDKSQEMANKFESAIHIMNSAMKDFAINQKVSVDLMKQAWREMSSSFDAMVAAQEGATGGGGKPATFEDDTVGKLKQEISLLEQERDRLKLNTDELRTQNEEIAKRRALLKSETTSDIGKDLIRANAMVDKTLPDAEAKLKELLRIKNELRSTPILDEKGVAKLDKSILTLINRIRDMRRNAAGTTLKDVLGMDESSVDAIARKMRALKNIKVKNPRISDTLNPIRAVMNEPVA